MARVDRLELLLETDGEGRVHATLGETSRRLDNVGDAAQRTTGVVNDLSGAWGKLGGVIGGIGLAEVIRHTVATNVEFERQRAVLTTLEGGQRAANVRMRELQQIASQTPAQLQEVVTAYATLRARGLDPTKQALLAYANVAAASGKSTQQFIEAVADAATGEMERLKEFGIVARQQGDEVAFTFQGTTTVVKRSAAEIEQYLQNIGRVEFAGAAEEQMKTLGGAASNLMDNLDQLAIAIGNGGLRGELSDLVATMAEATAGLTDLIEAGNRRDGIMGLLSRANQVAQVGINPNALRTLLRQEGMAAQQRAELEREASLLGRVEDAYTQLGTYLGGVFNRVRDETGKKIAAENEATDKLLKKLRDQAATYNASRTSVLEYQKAQALAGVTNAAAREEITRLYDAMIDAERAEEAAAAAAKRRTQDRKDSTREDAAARRELQAQVNLVQQLVDTFDPLARLQREYREAEAAFATAIAAGNATVEQRNMVLGQLRKEILQTAATQAEAQALIAAPEMGEASRQMWLEIGKAWADGAGDALTDALLTGDWESVGKQWMQMLFGDSLRAIMEEQLVTPLRAALDNGAGIGAGFRQIFSGRAYENDPNFVGPPSTLQGGGEAGAGTNWGAMVGGIGAAYGGYQAAREGNMGSTVMTYASYGAAVGGPWGAAIGAVVGVIVGLLAKPKPPDLRIGGEGVTRKPEHNFSTVFGDMQVGSRAGVDSMEWARAVGDFDRRMRDIFRAADYTGEQFDAIRSAMASWSIDVQGMDNITADAVLGSRFDAMMRAVEPQWAGFLANIDDLEDRVTALGALWDIEGQVESLGLAIDDLSASPLERLRTQLAALDDSVGSTADALSAAIAEQDPARIRDTAAAAQQAVMDRLNREIELVRSLQAAIEEAEASARALELSLAQRIQAAGGGVGLVAGVAQQQATLFRGNVTGTADPARALEWLDQFIGAVDTWLQAAIADTQQLAEEQQRAAQGSIDAIDAQLQAIEAAQQLARTIESEAAAALNRQLGLAQRISETGGDRGSVTAQAAAAMEAQRAAVGLASNAGTALERLDQFIAAVDTWLQSAVADVRAIADAQTRAAQAEMQAIDARLSAIGAERAAILSGAEERAAAERAMQQAAMDAARELQAQQEAARRAQVEALQQQLQIAQQWLGVLNTADDLLQQLTVGTANPLGGFGRMDILSSQIAERESALAGASGAGRARIAAELLDLLNQRITTVQQQGLFDRPSGDYLGIYNDTLRRIGDVRAIAAPAAESVEDLQRRIADLQGETTAAVDRLAEITVQLTADEQARLDALAAEEAALQAQRAALEQQLLDIQAQAQADIAALQATAREQYEWARTVGAELEAQRHAELLEQLAAITGGTPFDAFVAQAAELHAERTALEQQLLDIQAQAQADIAALQATAREQYEWARTVGAELEAQRHAELLEQLALITGGQDIDAWIADRTALAADLLTQIRDDLRAWMDSISAGGSPGDGTLPGIPGIPGGPGYGDMPPPFMEPPGNVAPRSINAEFNITVHASGDGADIGRQVSAEIDRQLPQLATKLRRELAVA